VPVLTVGAVQKDCLPAASPNYLEICAANAAKLDRLVGYELGSDAAGVVKHQNPPPRLKMRR